MTISNETSIGIKLCVRRLSLGIWWDNLVYILLNLVYIPLNKYPQSRVNDRKKKVIKTFMTIKYFQTHEL